MLISELAAAGGVKVSDLLAAQCDEPDVPCPVMGALASSESFA